MKLIKFELNDKIWSDVYDKVLKYSPHNSPVREQIRKNLGWWWNGDGLFRLKIYNLKNDIRKDLDEIN